MEIREGILYIPLTNYKKEIVSWALASPEDYDLLSKYKYHLYKRRNDEFYACSTVEGIEMSIHKLIMGSPPEEYCLDCSSLKSECSCK